MPNEDTGNNVRVHGIDLYYETHGTGEPLLLLHGGGGCHDDWAHAGREHFLREYSLITPDARGHGRSTNPSGTITHQQCALDTLALLDYLKVQKCKAIGISMGGNILLHMTASKPWSWSAPPCTFPSRLARLCGRSRLKSSQPKSGKPCASVTNTATNRLRPYGNGRVGWPTVTTI